nr:helix-turn-helix domain-containing protein [Thermomonospora catenispora]
MKQAREHRFRPASEQAGELLRTFGCVRRSPRALEERTRACRSFYPAPRRAAPSGRAIA